MRCQKHKDMINCTEILDDAIAIVAIPVTAFDLGAATWQLTPTIQGSAFAPPLSSVITIGIQPTVAGGALVPIIRRTGKAKDEESDSVAGRSHVVTVTCDVDERDTSVWDNLLALERTPSHLLLTFRDGTRAFVAATKDSYLCMPARDGSKTSVTFKVQNIMGIQTIL